MKIILTAYGFLIFATYIPLYTASAKKTAGYVSTFLQTADQLKNTADEMITECIPSYKRTAPITTQKLPSKHKTLKHAHLPSLRKKKKQAIAYADTSGNLIQQSIPDHTCLNGGIPLERISDTYVNALTFYIECIKTSSPITGMYIRMQMAHILERLTQLYTPIDLFSATTVFEPGYKEVIMQSQHNVREPFLHAVVLNDVIKKHTVAKKILKSHPSSKKNELLCTKLRMCMQALMHIYASNRIDAYHQIIIHAYTELTWRLLHKIPECPAKTTTMQSLYNEWHAMNLQPLNVQPLFDALKTQIKNSRELYSNPLVLKNTVFCDQIIKNQCNTLHHLLSLHQTQKSNPCKQYWIGKAAGTILKLISKISIDRKPEQQFQTICQKWQKKQLDISSILRHITTKQSIFPQESSSHTSLKLQPEQTVQACFEMLPVLIDLYTKHAIPPALLKRVTDPIETIIKTLFEVVHINAKHLSFEQQHIIARANRILRTSADSYKLSHTLLKADRLFQTEKAKAKIAYLETSEEIMHAYEAGILCDAILRDHVYSRLLNLYESKITFSPEECVKLQNFATFINMPLPHIIKLQADFSRENHALKTFIHKLAAEGLI